MPSEHAQSQPRTSQFRSTDVAADDDPTGMTVEAANPNTVEVKLDDDQLAAPNAGFGKLWRKLHTISLDSVDQSPTRIIAIWKAHFGEFWPGDNRFHAPITGIQPGEIAVMYLEMPGGATLSTGIVVVSSRPDTFALMTPRGHMFAGWIAFSVLRHEEHLTAQIEILMRASDPLFEIGMEFFGHRRENRFWEQTLRNLAAHFDLDRQAATRVELVDSHRQWSRAGNIWHNTAIRSMINSVTAPARRLLGRRKTPRDSLS